MCSFLQTFELIAFLAASLFMLIRLVFEFVDQLEDCTGDNLITCEVMFGVSVAFNIISWTFCYRMADDLRWKKYKVGNRHSWLLRVSCLWRCPWC